MSTKETYLQLESSLMLRLRKSWAPVAAGIYSRMTEQVSAGRFDDARALVQEIDLAPVAKANREYLKYTMWGFAVLGASQANDGKPLITGLTFEETLNHITGMLEQSLALNATEQTRDTALQLIANAETEYAKTQKADQPRFLKEFVSFAGKGDETMRMVSALHSTRLAAWGFLAEADLLGITKYRLSAVIDGRTSEFCRLINNKIFLVEDAGRDIREILAAQQPEDLKTLHPWPKQDDDSLKAYKKLTGKQLTALKLHIPPFHPYCRTMLIKLKKDSKTPKFPKLVNQESNKTLSTAQTFKELGVDVAANQLEAWNSALGVGPALMLAKISGVDPKAMLEGYLKTKAPISFTKDGNISFKGKTVWGKEAVATSNAVFDPFTQDFYLNYAEFKAADPQRAYQFFNELHVQMMKAAQVAGAESYTIQAGGALGVYSYTKLGFVPSQADWLGLREDLLVELAEGGKFFEMSQALSGVQLQVLNDLLAVSDPAALMALIDLPWRFNGTLIGKALLEGKTLKMSVLPEDPTVLKNLGDDNA